MPSGPIPPGPSELLGSRRAQQGFTSLRGLADVVIVDSPPVLPVSDALVLSSYVDATLLVANGSKTEQGDLRRALDLLAQVDARVVGTILNQVKKGTGGTYGYGYGYAAEATAAANRRFAMPKLPSKLNRTSEPTLTPAPALPSKVAADGGPNPVWLGSASEEPSDTETTATRRRQRQAAQKDVPRPHDTRSQPWEEDSAIVIVD